MSVKIILTQIMKDESSVINRMLDSIKPIVDGIVMIDTGSTDNSIELVREWGKDNGVETHVLSREFDNFENSRNYSITSARELFLNRNDGHTYYGMWLDADEILTVGKEFDKNKLTKDLYMFNTRFGGEVYTRNELYKLSKPFSFYGVLHEYLVCSDTTAIQGGIANGLTVDVKTDGASWVANSIAEKYIKHAGTLEKYINEDPANRTPRWVFYTAQSYFDSANVENDKEENDRRLGRAIEYYKERIGFKDGSF